MAKSVEIPQDIIDNVIAAVGNDTHLLKKCSLVSSSFLLPARKKLFSRISFRSDQTCRWQGILQVLVQNPDIRSFVRAISLTEHESTPIWSSSECTDSEWMNNSSLVAILRLPFRYLECFSIDVNRDDWNWFSWNWNAFSNEMKDALSNIIHSSTLKTFSLNGVAKVPNTFWPHIVRTTTLELDSLSPIDFVDENSSSLTWTASKGVAPMTSYAEIDRCVWHYSDYGPMDEIETTQSIFLPFMCRLRFFKIHANFETETMDEFKFPILSLLMDSLCISLTSPATLEHLELNLRLRSRIFGSDFESFYESLRAADVWSHLDSITNHPTSSRLQRIDINIDYSFRYEDDEEEPSKDEIEKAILDSLPSLRTNRILSVKAVLGECVETEITSRWVIGQARPQRFLVRRRKHRV